MRNPFVVLGCVAFAVVLVLVFIFVGWISPDDNQFYVFRNKTGTELPAGQIIANEGQKGTTREIHAQGWNLWWGKPARTAEGPFDRTEVGTREIGVLFQLDGKPLPDGWLLAPVRRDSNGAVILNEMGLPESDYKGVLSEYLTSGQYRIHPYLYKFEPKDMEQVAADEIGILVKRDGLPLPEGQFIAPIKRDADGNPLLRDGIPQSDYKGVLEDVLKPGTYRIHPYLYEFKTQPAVQVPAGSVGVVTVLTGESMPEGVLLAKEGQRGVQEKVMKPGTYYLNPYKYKVDKISIQSQITEFLEDNLTETYDEIDFPSSDGFLIHFDVAVEWSADKDRVASIYVLIGDLKAMLDKVVVPNTRSIARVEGSKYGARNFIEGTTREKFEGTFFAELKRVCGEKGIIIHRALVRKIVPPEEISKPIREAEVARQELLRNKEETERAKSAALKAEEEARIVQRQQQINAETTKMVAETDAKRRLAVSDIDLEVANKEAQATESRGKAAANVVFWNKKAEADGTRLMTEAFGGGEALAMFEMAKRLSENTAFVWMPSNEGTFWGGTMDNLQAWIAKMTRDRKNTDKSSSNKSDESSKATPVRSESPSGSSAGSDTESKK